MSPSRRSASGNRSRATPSRPGLMSRPLVTAARRAASTSASPDPQPNVEHASARANGRGIEHRLEQRLIVRLGQIRPRSRVGAPQSALDRGGGADRRPAAAALRSARAARAAEFDGNLAAHAMLAFGWTCWPSARRATRRSCIPAMTSLSWCSLSPSRRPASPRRPRPSGRGGTSRPAGRGGSSAASAGAHRYAGARPCWAAPGGAAS
jgi:hypothetical protein